jgi:outer membrane lipoprotein-sorting protein
VTYINNIWRQGVRYRIETYDGSNKLIKTIVCDGDSVYVTEYNGADVSSHTFPVNDSFTLEQQAGMLSVEDVRAALGNTGADNTDETSGETAGSRDINNVTVSLNRSADSSVYHVEYDYLAIPLHEQLDISLEYGFIIKAETYETGENTLTYSLVTDKMQTGITGYPGVNIFSPDA